MDPVKIGSIIKRLRKENNLTQKELASELGVTYQAVSKWENGKNLPDILVLKKISILYKIDIKELLDGNLEGKLNHEKRKKNKVMKRIIVIIITLLIIFLMIIIKYNTNNDNFEFKKITSSCEEFEITGSVAYNKTKSYIYISSIDYCGNVDDEVYKMIECTLYEDYQDSHTKIGTCGIEKEDSTLNEFLDKVEINVNNYNSSCKLFSRATLYLELKALNQEDKLITYYVPINLEDNCD